MRLGYKATRQEALQFQVGYRDSVESIADAFVALNQFWSEPFVWTSITVSINHGLAVLHVAKDESDVVDAPVYLFTSAGSYLGKSERTDGACMAEFLLPDQQYKFRVNYDGTQYWSDEVAIIPHEENNIQLNLDLLALDLTNNPNPVRFDGVPPEYKPEKVMVASLGSLTGLLVQSVVAQTPAENIYYCINDHLGTPHKMIDENGEVVWSADYKPFGEADVTVTTVQNNFRFPGQYYDSESQLHYNYLRYYHPQTGRYLTLDPIGLAGGINLFAYVHNNSINLIDPFGLWFIDVGVSGAATGTLGPGGTIGFQASSSGLYWYYGVGLGIGGGFSATYHPIGEPSEDVSVTGTVRGGTGVVGAQAGGSLSEDGFSWTWEAGY